MSTSRQLAAIMFTDIVGYTALMGKDSQKALELVRVSKEIQKSLVEKHHGNWLKEMGDGALISFNTALDAVNCSIEIQQSARIKLDAKLRIGIHLGDITIEKNDVYGDGVNVAARLESVADPGGIYISDNIEKSIKGQTDVQAKYLGEIKLKNVAYDVRAYALQGEGLPVPEINKSKEISSQLLAKIQRRGIIRVAITYIAFSLFLILLVPYADSVLDFPKWTITALLGVLVAGFPIAIYLAWNYERSPEGFVLTSSEESWQNPHTSSQRKPLTSNVFILMLFIFNSILYFFPKYSDLPENTLSEIKEKSVAVIPFSDMSPSGDQKYLADGVQEAILNHLARIKDMRVISRTTMEMYRESNKSITSIANEVGVSYILEGSVQRLKDQVRITVQLVEGNSDQHLWSENYDRDISDIFAIQTEIAKNVAEELKATVTAKEKAIIESVPTTDLTAYDYYLKGIDYRNRSNYENDLRFATQMFKRAIEIDSTFTLAWVGLAASSRSIYWFHYDRTEEHLSQTKQELDKAIALDPDLMEVRLETGRYHYQCEANYAEALLILEELKSEYPNNSQMHAWPGFIYRRMGHFEKSFEYLDRAISLNPSAWAEWSYAGYNLVILRRYQQAEDYFYRSIALNPSRDRTYFYLAQLYLTTGEVEKARSWLDKNQSIVDPWMYMKKSLVELYDDNYEEALGILVSSPNEIFEDQDFYTPKSMQIGLIYFSLSQMELSRTHFQEARQHLENKLIELPNDSRLYSSLGIVYAGLGMKKEAEMAGNKALSIINVSMDADKGFYRELDMARILLMTGKYQEAISKLEYLIQQNGNISVELLKRDPFWAQLRELEAYKAVIENPDYQVNLHINGS